MGILDDVSSFAELCALYDDPFTDRALLLSTAGLSAEDWAELRAAWRARLAAGDEQATRLGLAFRRAYGAARDGNRTANKPRAPEPGHGRERGPLVKDGEQIPQGAAVQTNETSQSAEVTEPLPIVRRSAAEASRFMRDALPFDRKPTPEAEPGGAKPLGAPKRFVRFDPQTGRPLASPYWEDVPADIKKA